jgi:hypothetical protein
MKVRAQQCDASSHYAGKLQTWAKRENYDADAAE